MGIGISEEDFLSMGPDRLAVIADNLLANNEMGNSDLYHVYRFDANRTPIDIGHPPHQDQSSRWPIELSPHHQGLEQSVLDPETAFGCAPAKLRWRQPDEWWCSQAIDGLQPNQKSRMLKRDNAATNVQIQLDFNCWQYSETAGIGRRCYGAHKGQRLAHLREDQLSGGGTDLNNSYLWNLARPLEWLWHQALDKLS